jgi:hypothetical protein
MEAATRICAALDAEAGAEMAFPNTLNDFVWTGALEEYMERLPGS